jgi:hypothetical protein
MGNDYVINKLCGCKDNEELDKSNKDKVSIILNNIFK